MSPAVGSADRLAGVHNLVASIQQVNLSSIGSSTSCSSSSSYWNWKVELVPPDSTD